MTEELFNLYRIDFTYGTSKKNTVLIGAQKTKKRITLLEFLERNTPEGISNELGEIKISRIEDTGVKIDKKGVIFLNTYTRGREYFSIDQDEKLQEYHDVVHNKIPK